jgi:hypothetical protein
MWFDVLIPASAAEVFFGYFGYCFLFIHVQYPIYHVKVLFESDQHFNCIRGELHLLFVTLLPPQLKTRSLGADEALLQSTRRANCQT